MKQFVQKEQTEINSKSESVEVNKEDDALFNTINDQFKRMSSNIQTLQEQYKKITKFVEAQEKVFSKK